MAYVFGGGNRTTIINLNATHTALGAVALEIGKDTDDIVNSTNFAYDDNGVPTLTISTTRFDDAFFTFANTAAPKKQNASGGVARNEKIGEDGRKIGGTAADADTPRYAVITYSGITEGTGGGQRLVSFAVGTFKRNAGARQYGSPTDAVETSLEFVGEALKSATLAPTNAMLDDKLVVVTGHGISLAKDFFITEKFLAKAVVTP